MREVAALAKVSIKTVSRVVNGESGVSPSLAKRVLAASERLNYRHNLTASSLRRSDGRSATIGIVLEDVSNPFFSAVHRGVEEVARERGVLTFAGSSDQIPQRERELAEAFGARGVDGLIIVPASTDHSYLLRDRDAIVRKPQRLGRNLAEHGIGSLAKFRAGHQHSNMAFGVGFHADQRIQIAFAGARESRAMQKSCDPNSFSAHSTFVFLRKTRFLCGIVRQLQRPVEQTI